MFAAAAILVEEAYRQAPVGSSLPNLENLALQANRVRAAVRSRNPDDLDFHLNEDFVPDSFLRGDIRVDDRRHLLLASDRMLELLTRAKHWYADTDMSSKSLPYKLSFYWRNTSEHNVVIIIFAVDLINSIKITISMTIL